MFKVQVRNLCPANSKTVKHFHVLFSRLQIAILTYFGYLQSTANSHFNVFLAICSRLQIATPLNFTRHLSGVFNKNIRTEHCIVLT